MLLGEALRRDAGREDVVVLGLPRGGIPVAYEVASALDAPLDVLVVRKIGVPRHEEFAMGAIASGGILVLDHYTIARLGISSDTLRAIVERERAELERRDRIFRGDRRAIDIAGRTVILIDDGLATGASMRAALHAIKTRSPARLIVAVPVASRTTCKTLRPLVHEMVCLVTPEDFQAVGLWYEDFSQTSDAEVRTLLERAYARRRAAPSLPMQPAQP
jgi:putative phosphoribosyl transferase